MLDYIFYYPESRGQFTRFLDSRRIPYRCQDDPLGLVVAIPEELDDALLGDVETCYESLLQEQESLSTLEDNSAHKTATALTVQLASGQTAYALIPAQMMRRLLSVLSAEEIGQLVHAIASAVENPDPRPLCQR